MRTRTIDPYQQSLVIESKGKKHPIKEFSFSFFKKLLQIFVVNSKCPASKG